MRPSGRLHDLGQSLWLDNVTRELLNSGHDLRSRHKKQHDL